MYVPDKFSTDERDAWRIVRDAGAGVLVGSTSSGLASVFVPVLVRDEGRTLVAHVARANPWWRQVPPDTEVLGLFLAASAYVSPSLYPSRFDDPGVVPTWNYVAAEVRGRLKVHDDPTWLDEQVRSLTDQFEAGRIARWRVEDAPAPYVNKQLRAIVGIEIEVTSIEGKSKLSQNRPTIDHDHVRDEMSTGTLAERNVAQRMDPRG